MVTTRQSSDEVGGVRSDVLAQVLWSAGAALLCLLGALHLLVVVGFAVGVGVSPILAPSAAAASLIAAWWFSRQSGLAGGQRITAVLLVVTVLAACLALAATFIDVTWDGQWYHQTAVYKMAEGWNPVRDPMHDFGRHSWNLWVLHYAKGPWYLALTLFAATGSIEIAKATSAIAPAVTLLVVLAAALDLGLSRRSAILVASLTALNPVTTCGIVTHQVDGILVSFMAAAVAAGIVYLRRPRWQPALVAVLSVALCVNTKFTGLVYVCCFVLAGGMYSLWRRRDVFARYAVLAAALRVGTWPLWRRAAAAIAFVLLIDTLLLSAVHMRWEWRSTDALRQQLADLRHAGPMTVGLAYFDVPVAARLRDAGVAFDTVRRYQCTADRQLTLMSVCRGYPEWIRVCLADQVMAARLQAQPHWQWSAEP